MTAFFLRDKLIRGYSGIIKHAPTSLMELPFILADVNVLVLEMVSHFGRNVITQQPIIGLAMKLSLSIYHSRRNIDSPAESLFPENMPIFAHIMHDNESRRKFS